MNKFCENALREVQGNYGDRPEAFRAAVIARRDQILGFYAGSEESEPHDLDDHHASDAVELVAQLAAADSMRSAILLIPGALEMSYEELVTPNFPHP